MNYDDLDFSSLIPDDMKVDLFPSGLKYYNDVFSFVKDNIRHEKTKNYLADFLENGGTFELKFLSNCKMEYDFVDEIIGVGEGLFTAKQENNEAPYIISCLSHELHHAQTKHSCASNGHDIVGYYNKYNEKSVQIIDQGLEVGANYFQIVSGWEEGEKFRDYLTDEYKELFTNVEKYLNNNHVEMGEKIPKKLLSGVGDMTVEYFTKTAGVEYKKELISFLTPNICEGKNKKSMTAKELFDYMECPVTFSDEQLDSMLLFSSDMEKIMKPELMPYVSFSKKGQEEKIEKTISSYLAPINPNMSLLSKSSQRMSY